MRAIVFIVVFSSLLSLAAYNGTAAEKPGIATAKQFQDAFSGVAEKAVPGVVTIKVLGAKQRSQLQQLPPQLRRLLPQNPYDQDNARELPVGQGSGFIVSEDGHVVTNNHVVENGKEFIVGLQDGREYPAKVVGSDWKADIAVLKIAPEKPLPILKFADSDKVKPGHWAIAIGSPYSLEYSITVGVVSQKGRVMGMNIYEDYIQTDAPINPGNSGGPLLNIDGEVIGVNDFIMTPGGAPVGNAGLAFAIPSNMARQIVEQLIKNGEVQRPWLGISMQKLDASLKKQFKTERGVLVREVFTGAPADKVGIEPGDIILTIDGRKLESPHDVQLAILKHKPGDKIPMEIQRGNSSKNIELIAGRQKNDELAGEEEPGQPAQSLTQNSSVFKDFGITLTEQKNAVYIAEVNQGS
ncbi:MAG: hypothetical protein A2X49_01330, partial [Lentisphaerae bacterium GWF2_52_8]